MKKRYIILTALAVLLAMALCACGNNDPGEITIPLNEDETAFLELMSDSIHVLSDEDFGTVATRIMEVGRLTGLVYQLDGTLAFDGDQPYLTRTLKNGGEKTEVRIPLRYLTKDIADGTWVSVTGIVSEIELDGTASAALDIVSIEAYEGHGSQTVKWSGPEETGN